MNAIKIKMKANCFYSNNLLEIDQIYLTGCTEPGYYKKEIIYDYLKDNPKSIQVNIYPYPYLIPALSSRGEKYVKSENNNTERDNLLALPREK